MPLVFTEDDLTAQACVRARSILRADEPAEGAARRRALRDFAAAAAGPDATGVGDAVSNLPGSWISIAPSSAEVIGALRSASERRARGWGSWVDGRTPTRGTREADQELAMTDLDPVVSHDP